MILAGELQRPGIVPLMDWLPIQRLLKELGKRNVRIAVRKGDSTRWQTLRSENPEP